jgi:predicted transcriptional regulator
MHFNLPNPILTGDNKKDIMELTDAYHMLRKELIYLLTHLDERNVLKARVAQIAELYAGNITTDQIVAGTAKIALALIEDIVAENIVTNTFITNTLYAEKAIIAELTVDQLDTSVKVLNYLNTDTSDVNYIKIYENHIQFITAETDGLNDEHLKDRNGNSVYWTDNTYTGVTLTVTDYPVKIYVYTELIKRDMTFVEIGGEYSPVSIEGAGSGSTDNPNRMRGFIYKDIEGLLLKYVQNDDTELDLRIGDEGIYQTGYTGAYGLRNIAVGSTYPSTNLQTNDLWIDTSSSTGSSSGDSSSYYP